MPAWSTPSRTGPTHLLPQPSPARSSRWGRLARHGTHRVRPRGTGADSPPATPNHRHDRTVGLHRHRRGVRVHAARPGRGRSPSPHGLRRSLDIDELNFVIAHERAHARHRHDRYKLLALFTTAFVPPIATRRRRRLEYHLERWADEEALDDDRYRPPHSLLAPSPRSPSPGQPRTQRSASPTTGSRHAPQRCSARSSNRLTGAEPFRSR